jgi:branched-chain amino acid transport system substrate-binding protein
VKNGRNLASQKRKGRREFRIKTGIAAGAIAAFDGLNPVSGSLAQIGAGCVNAAKVAVGMINDAGGIKSLSGAKQIAHTVPEAPCAAVPERSSYLPAVVEGR